MPGPICAVVVGIERYQHLAQFGDLDGPAPDGCRFVDWLMQRGVAGRDIRLLLSPLPKNQDVRPETPGAPEPQPANQQAIEEAILDDLLAADPVPSALYLFIGGHGVMDRNQDRHVVTADAREEMIQTINVDHVMERLRWGGRVIERQVIIVDACSVRETDAALTSTRFNSADRGLPVRQTLLYAAGIDQRAKNLNRSQTGLFSSNLLAVLQGHPGEPPDWEAIARDLKDAFAGVAGQTPQFFEVVVDGNRRFLMKAGGADDQGEFVSKLCDRNDQDQIFFRECTRQVGEAVPLRTYLLLGNRFEAHRSLLARFIRFRVAPAIEKKHGVENGAVAEIGPLSWPISPAVDDAKIVLAAALSNDAESQSIELTSALGILQESPSFGGGYRAVVVSQEVELRAWNDRERELLEWYLGQFWTGSPKPGAPIVFLFLLVKWPEELPEHDRDALTAFLRERERDGARRLKLLVELDEVPEGDVEKWFEKYVEPVVGHPINAIDEARKLCESTPKRRDGKRRTDALEDNLTTAHRTLVRGKGIRR